MYIVVHSNFTVLKLQVYNCQNSFSDTLLKGKPTLESQFAPMPVSSSEKEESLLRPSPLIFMFLIDMVR